MTKFVVAFLVCAASVFSPCQQPCQGQTATGAESKAPITAVVIDTERPVAVVGSQRGLVVRSLPDLKVLQELPTTLSSIHDIAISSDGRRLVAIGGVPGESGSVELYEWPSGKKINHVSPHQDVIYGVAWSPDSTSFATASADKTVQIFDLDCQNRGTLQGHSRAVMAVDFLPKELGLLSAGVDTSIRYWDWLNLEPNKSLKRTLINHTKDVYSIEARRNSKDTIPVVASISQDRTVRFWQPTIGRMMRFVRLESVPLDFCWLSDGTQLAVACQDGRVRYVAADTAQVVQTIEALDGIAYCIAADSKNGLLIGGVDGRLRYLTPRE
jgi:WD40 repeat protein